MLTTQILVEMMVRYSLNEKHTLTSPKQLKHMQNRIYENKKIVVDKKKRISEDEIRKEEQTYVLHWKTELFTIGGENYLNFPHREKSFYKYFTVFNRLP